MEYVEGFIRSEVVVSNVPMTNTFNSREAADNFIKKNGGYLVVDDSTGTYIVFNDKNKVNQAAYITD